MNLLHTMFQYSWQMRYGLYYTSWYMPVSNIFTDMIKTQSFIYAVQMCPSDCDVADRIPYFYGTSNFLTEKPAFRSCMRLRFHERFLTALLWAARFKWTSVFCYFCSAVVKVMAPAAGTSVSPRLAGVVLCCAAGWRRMGRGTSVSLVETALPVFSFWKRSLNAWTCDLEQLIVAQPLNKLFAFL